MLIRRVVVGRHRPDHRDRQRGERIRITGHLRGLITAGVAVALQTVILSGVAYFFFIGRFGVRVGDRVTITNITGDVIEIGLFRIYLMELSGSRTRPATDRPSRRLLQLRSLQPSAFYKQLPLRLHLHEVR